MLLRIYYYNILTFKRKKVNLNGYFYRTKIANIRPDKTVFLKKRKSDKKNKKF